MTFKPLNDQSHLYFITATLLGWRPLFARPEFAWIILDSLDWHRQQCKFAMYAFVIMPTHFHIIIKPTENLAISENLQSLGSFTAHAIVKKLRDLKLQEDLEFFATQRQPDRTEQRQLWQPIQAKNIFSREFLIEKMEYIHNNPVAKKWSLAATRDAYEFSSAPFYDRGEIPVIEIDDVREWL